MDIKVDSFLPFIGSKFIDLLKSGTDRAAEEIVQAFTNKISDYIDVEFERNSKTKTILHRHAPIELEKFYQPLFIKSGVESWARDMNSSKSKRIPTKNVEDVFSKGNCVTIIGTAGSGKSTLVKYLFVNAIETEYKIPIKVELRYLNDYDKDLLTYIIEEIIKYSRMAKDDKVVDRMLSSGAFIIFFDGYDEISTAKKEAITKDICKIAKKYRDNVYVLTSRPFVNVDMLEGFINYQVCELSDAEIESFVKKQFNDSEQELANRIIQTIKDESSKAYRSFLSNPLLLSMFIITYQTDSNIPQKRSEYYDQVFNTLYSVHDTSSKLGYVREKKTGLSKENFVEILKRFSFKSYFQQKYSFTLGYIENRLNDLKKDLHLSFANEDFIEDTEVAIGILTQEGLEITFPHRSLQEYFAALYVTTVSDSNKKKIYKFLYQSFKKSRRYIHDDISNFFSLLFEMDTEGFKRELVIPLLNEIKLVEKRKLLENNRSDENGMVYSIIDCFLLLYSVSQYVNSSTSDLFDKENKKYNEKFRMYKNEKFKIYEDKKTKLKKQNANNQHEMDVVDDAREELAKNDILPFLEGFVIDDIIRVIENDIDESESKDAEFIDSLFVE